MKIRTFLHPFKVVSIFKTKAKWTQIPKHSNYRSLKFYELTSCKPKSQKHRIIKVGRHLQDHQCNCQLSMLTPKPYPQGTSRCLLNTSRRHCLRSTWFRKKIEWMGTFVWAMQGTRACGVPRMSLGSLSPLWILFVMILGRGYWIADWPIQINLSPNSWFLLMLEFKFCPSQKFPSPSQL